MLLMSRQEISITVKQNSKNIWMQFQQMKKRRNFTSIKDLKRFEKKTSSYYLTFSEFQ